jgi:hypothetical protein
MHIIRNWGKCLLLNFNNDIQIINCKECIPHLLQDSLDHKVKAPKIAKIRWFGASSTGFAIKSSTCMLANRF